MRLINTTTFELGNFGGGLPPYAILSHTWGEDEVTLHDMADVKEARKKPAFSKIEQCCRQAFRDGLEWAWVDTCCIDKSSSAELSETINSMYKFYERAMKCYAILSDVVASPDNDAFTDPQQYLDQHPPGTTGEYLTQYPLFESRWWTRGWTLQELIAPHDVEFYNCRWEYLTSKRACKELIRRFSGIDEPILSHSRSLETVCVADRMSWAAGRYTTREEDMAYCLLGIFNVNMPLLYGEGANAFQRLQQEILALTEDYTLLLWGIRSYDESLKMWYFPRFPFPITKILATSPRDFGGNRGWHLWSDAKTGMPLTLSNNPPEMTSRGLRLTMFLRRVTKQDLIGDSELSHSLRTYLDCVSKDGFADFVRWVRPLIDSIDTHPIYLGAFPSDSASTVHPLLPCILLIGLNSVGHISKDFDVAYARVLWFFCKVPRWDVDLNSANSAWKLKTCYLKTRADSEMNTCGLKMHDQTRPWVSYRFWTWRGRHPKIPQFAFNIRTSETETRRCLHLKPMGFFPGLLIEVAAARGRYWMGHILGSDFDIDAEAAKFETLDLTGKWIWSSREAGPVVEEKVDFPTGTLSMTLMIDKLGVFDWYNVSLAFIEQ
ncbi:heterokaryon incompatibility protein-domain-containing protein [Podospora australis]|uniref:Heterokaryon incompatibility protein-domain-containing protein n=1 Tax=Podospora australis TaxID=1536484 RepID=A0AAN6WKR3_9PEZI|nr:heterokaryon incompatibility protein-domain-containing protein [Podospora australis]